MGIAKFKYFTSLSIIIAVVFFTTLSPVKGHTNEPSQDDQDTYTDESGIVPIKKASFWSPHPSDYNPMRRPGPPRNLFGNKRNSYDFPYHPVPRMTTIKQRAASSPNTLDDFYESELFDEERSKRQTRPAILIYRIRSPQFPFNSRRNPGQKYVPVKPNSSSN